MRRSNTFAQARGGDLLRWVLAVACAAVLSWARIEFNSIYLPGALENVAGIDPRGAAEPFAYRVLVPKLVRFLHENVFTAATPLSLFRVLDTAFIVLAFAALRRLARESFGPRWAVDACSFGLFALLPCHFVLSREYPFWYAWDMAAVALFTYGLWLLKHREWVVFYALFAVGSFNRETTCFLSFAYLFTSWREESRGRLAAHLAAQAALWFAVKWWLQALYRRQPGGVFQPAWVENGEALLDPAMWRWFALAFGGTWMALPFVYRRIEERWIRALVWVVVPFAAGMFVVGVWTELRIWGELVPVVLLALTAGLGGRSIAASRSAA
ncbi:MAG: hypothetical protein IT454_01465 [Planctomycetes bacterium]|nr:hypothetical protein [Planctomycetota bacterium]